MIGWGGTPCAKRRVKTPRGFAGKGRLPRGAPRCPRLVQRPKLTGRGKRVRGKGKHDDKHAHLMFSRAGRRGLGDEGSHMRPRTRT